MGGRRNFSLNCTLFDAPLRALDKEGRGVPDRVSWSNAVFLLFQGDDGRDGVGSEGRRGKKVCVC